MENKYAKGFRLLLMLEASSQATGNKHSKQKEKDIYIWSLEQHESGARERLSQGYELGTLNRWLIETSSHTAIDSEQLHLTDLEIA